MPLAYRKCAWAALAAMLPALCARADEPAGAGSQVDTTKSSVLLLRDGSIVSGRILPSGDDFLVRRPSGNMHVPGSLVRLHCQDLRDAHRRLHQKAAEQADPAEHVAVARWCLTYHLTAEARQELKAALSIDPGRSDARRLLARLDELEEFHRAALAAEAAPQGDQANPPRDVVPSESLAGLSPRVARQFTQRIQPLLVNNCSTAGCHGRESNNGFRLQRVISGQNASRAAAERNLAEVLKYVDLANPAASPLVALPRANHGRRGRQPFSGRGGPEQLEELRHWARAAARDLARRQEQQRPAGAPEPSGSGGTIAVGRTGPDVHAPHPQRVSSRQVISTQAGDQSGLLVGKSAEVDPFDPAVFNRQSAAGPGRPVRPR